MRASSSWIKLQFVVRKHVMNTYQVHTLSLFLFYHIFSPSALSLIFFVFWLQPPSLWLIPSLFFWWSVILMWRIQMCCIMYSFVCTCVCICVCSHFLGADICDTHLGECLSYSYCCLLGRVSVLDHLHVLWTTVAKLVYLFLCRHSHLITGLCGDVLIWKL